jgi:hypothetical protein
MKCLNTISFDLQFNLTAAREPKASLYQFGGRVFISNVSNLETREKYHLMSFRVSISMLLLLSYTNLRILK